MLHGLFVLECLGEDLILREDEFVSKLTALVDVPLWGLLLADTILLGQDEVSVSDVQVVLRDKFRFAEHLHVLKEFADLEVVTLALNQALYVLLN